MCTLKTQRPLLLLLLLAAAAAASPFFIDGEELVGRRKSQDVSSSWSLLFALPWPFQNALNNVIHVIFRLFYLP